MAPLKVCICGGGKTAQILAILGASNPETEVNVLCLEQDEATDWNKYISDKDMVLTIHESADRTRDVKAKPATVGTDPSVAVPGCALIIIATPAYNHETYLKAITGHVDKKMSIVGLPGLPGFEYQCKQILGDLGNQVTIMSYQTHPWACRIVEPYAKLEITKTFKELQGSMLRGKAIPRKPALMSLQSVLGFDPMLAHTKHPVELLFISYTFLQPAIVYGKWKSWDGKPVDEQLSFFESVDEETAKIVENCCAEYLAVANAITAQKPEVDLSEIKDIFTWLVSVYRSDIEDATNLFKALSTNKGHPEMLHEMSKVKNKFKPEFNCRALTEHVPYGMVVVRGAATLLGVETPVCDEVITWCQEKLNRKYLVDGQLTGNDVTKSRAPQQFELTNLDQLLAGTAKPQEEFDYSY